MDLTLPAVGLAWTALMAGPAVAIAIAARQARWGKRNHARLLVRSLALLATVLIAAAFGIRFAWPPANWLAVASAWGAWCVLVGLLFAIRPRPVGIGLGIVASLSFLPGLFLGTIGILGLMFIVGDYARPPLTSRTMSPGLDCVITRWGSAVSDDGHNIDLYRYWRWFPAIRRRVVHVVVDETRPDPTTRSVTCDSAARARR